MAEKEKQYDAVGFGDIEIMRNILKIMYGGERDCLAMRLIDRFGGVAGVFGASQAELMRVEGVTERVASFFSFVRPMYRQALLRSAPNYKFRSESDYARYAAVYFMTDRVPADVCVYLDGKREAISFERLIGEDRTAEILSGACRNAADEIALLHFVPRESDLSALRTLRRLETIARLLPALELIDVKFADYIEYFPFGLISLRRALRGDGGAIAVHDASSSLYDRAAECFSGLNEYITELQNRITERGLR